MSVTRAEQARRYRHHAEELRSMIHDWRDPGSVQKVIDLARDYDRMAEDAEREVNPDQNIAEIPNQ